ncbi:adenylyl-sulfate kinase [Chitinophaga barathri]|uniref:Adenylyl-sulfate kinase n=1 Tax=Chitinophaga barathri TaxID=1647451 RepID=A0A3N4MG90_9BACT|nr:adenylyl-sulfate kinase [Chitinophaga barathri]RPD42618.1 adenylyl-sulfate kinase [Chitinophaga barathri]
MPLIQLTGLSGSGKTTIGELLKARCLAEGRPAELLDGDDCRRVLSRDLGFSANDRKENIRRLGYVGNLLSRNGVTVVMAAINPFESIRLEMEQLYGARTVYLDCSLPELIRRDTKELYKRALLPDGHPQKLYNLSGINDPYEIPFKPHLILDTEKDTPDVSVDKLSHFIRNCK